MGLSADCLGGDGPGTAAKLGQRFVDNYWVQGGQFMGGLQNYTHLYTPI